MLLALSVAALLLVLAAALALANQRKRAQAARTAAVVVVGDVARSPRMCNHVASLLQHGWQVQLVGYLDTPLPPPLRVKAVHPFPLPAPPRAIMNLPRALFPLVAAAKVAVQTAGLLAALLRGAPRVVLVQNPPAVPTLGVARVACAILGSVLVIDWHNLGYTILALRLGDRHPLVRLYELGEHTLGARADMHLFVTEAMRRTLVQRWALQGATCVLYDRAPAHFRRATLPAAHSLFTRMEGVWSANGTAKTPFTEATGDGTIVRRPGRPALLVTSTSWTPDEDIGMLLNALSLYEARAKAKAHALPRLEVVITGKGPLRASYEAQIAERAKREAWSHTHVATAWLAAADYPLLLGAADLGVSLHSSSSGLDLPMKVVDMLGCGLPVCALRFACLDELVQPGRNGEVFDNADTLCSALCHALSGFPVNHAVAKAHAGFLDGTPATWEANWDAVLAPWLAKVAPRSSANKAPSATPVPGRAAPALPEASHTGRTSHP